MNRAATDLVIEIQTKSDLSTATWQTVSTQLVSQIANGPVDQITVRPLDLPASPTRFFRLSVRLGP